MLSYLCSDVEIMEISHSQTPAIHMHIYCFKAKLIHWKQLEVVDVGYCNYVLAYNNWACMEECEVQVNVRLQ